MTPIDYIAFGDFLYNTEIKPRQLDISSRQINYWKDKKVAPFFKDKRGKKMNIPEAIWVCLMKELLDIGIGVDKLAILAKDVWEKPRKDKFADKVILENINNNKNPLPKEQIDILKLELKDEILMNTLRTEINPFTEAIKSCFYNSNEPHSFVYVPKTGEHTFLLHDRELNIKLSSLYQKNTLINIPLFPILSKIVVLDFIDEQKSINYLNDIENQIRDIVIFKKPKYIEIAFEEGHIKPIIISEQHKDFEGLVRLILKNKIQVGSKLLIEIRSQGNYKLTLITK